MCGTYGARDSFLRFDSVLTDWANVCRTYGARETKDAALKGRRYMSELKLRPPNAKKQIPRADTALGMTLVALRMGGAFSGRGAGRGIGAYYGVTVTRTVLDLIMVALSGSGLWRRT